MARKDLLSTIGLLTFVLLTACTPETSRSTPERAFAPRSKTSSLSEAEFVPNPPCTMPSTWDPQVGPPSAAALAQLAPQGKLRVGVYTGNGTVGSLANGVISGPAVDVACRLAASFNLPLELTAETTVPLLLADYTALKWDIGFSIDPNVVANVPPDVAYVHAFAAAEQTYLVPAGSPFLSVNDVDRPGVMISVLSGTGTEIYLAKHLQFATLLRFANNNDAFNALKNGQVDAFAIGRAGATMFNANWGAGNGRILPDNYTLIVQYPFMKNSNGDGICYLTDYIEAAKTSGLLTQALARSPPPTIGRAAPPSLPGCSPNARCHDVIVSADNSCHGSASIDLGSDDPDSDLAGCTQSPGAPYALGTTPVTLTCIDVEGLTSSCSATVTVVDTTPPAIVCPADQTLECSAGGAVAKFAPTVTDNCGASVTCTPPSGASISEDTPTAATCVAVDGSGNQASCAFTITVQDTLGPSVRTRADANGFIASLWPPNHTYHMVSLADCIKEAVDACDGATVTSTIINVTSDEPESGKGDDTCNNIVIVDGTRVQLRAERNGNGDGRVYSISAVVTDDDGNATPVTCKVEVRKHRCGEPAVANAAAYCVGQDCGAVPGHDPHCKQQEEGNDDGDDAEDHCGGDDDHGGGKDR